MGISIGGIVQQLWEEGMIEFPAPVEPEVFKRVLKDKYNRWIIVEWNPGRSIQRDFALYSPIDHLPIFFESAGYLKQKGPSEIFPGSVAAIGIGLVAEFWEISYLQCLYIQGKPETLTRRIATNYGGARHHLLEY